MASRPRSGRLGFVPVRFGDDLVGGAEMLVREMADGLAQRGWAVDVLTGCTRDHFREPRHYAPGTSVRASGVRLHRFPSMVSSHRADRVLGNRAIVSGRPLTLGDQYRWCNDDVRVPGLFDHLVAHADEYRALVFAPYLYWTTVAGTQVSPERSILIPCLHDEPTARLDLFAREFREPRGVWFLTEPEADLGRRLHPDLAPHAVIGSGVEPPAAGDPERFRARFEVRGPFVLYVGRREEGKGTAQLLTDFAAAAPQVPERVTLILAGPGSVRIPESARALVTDVGELTTRDRDDALAAATAVIQPSPYESFSRTMMEAWLAGAFVIASRASAVSTWHCGRAAAGAVYGSPDELAVAIRRALGPGAREDGERGRAYAAREYSWPRVLERVEAWIDEWLPVP
ncbi:MAG: glycosyltransferase family 4 protein [Actinomycetota bacterium]